MFLRALRRMNSRADCMRCVAGERGAVDSRSITDVSVHRMRCADSGRHPRKRRFSALAASQPVVSCFGRMLLSVGESNSQRSVSLSTPSTATWSGTLSPELEHAAATSIATRSQAAMTATGFGSSASQSPRDTSPLHENTLHPCACADSSAPNASARMSDQACWRSVGTNPNVRNRPSCMKWRAPNRPMMALSFCTKITGAGAAISR